MTSIIRNITPLDGCQKEEGNFLEGVPRNGGAPFVKGGSKPGGNFIAKSDCFAFSLTKFENTTLFYKNSALYLSLYYHHVHAMHDSKT